VHCPEPAGAARHRVNQQLKDTMTTPNQTIESAIVAAGANVTPRITLADIAANIVGEYYFTADKAVQAAFIDQDELTRITGMHGELRLLTFCVLVLRNGFTVTGESACASPENFNAEIGRRIARENAVAKLWPLMGYELRSKLASR
jgi:Phage protein (N4 Gp49/phage Sf6 gene 66) family